MTKEEIIQMANQANLPYDYVGGELMWLDKLEQFAKLVAEKERRACARICAEVGMWCLVHEIEGRGQE